MAAYSLIPDALYNSFATLAALTAPDLPLTGQQQEMIATVVMSAHHNPDSVESHMGFLRRGALDEELVRVLQNDYKTAPLSEQDKVMLDYAVQLIRDATCISPQDHGRLRAAGVSARALLLTGKPRALARRGAQQGRARPRDDRPRIARGTGSSAKI